MGYSRAPRRRLCQSPAGWVETFRGPGGRRHRREARLGCRQNFWPRARRDERRRPGIRSRASFRSSRRFGSPKSCSGSLGSGCRRTAACAWLALAQRGRNSKHGVWRRSGALGVVGFAADARSSCSAPEGEPEPLKRKENARHRFNTRRGQNQLVSKRQSRRALSTTSSRSRKWTSKLAARSARSRRQNSLRDCLQSRARKNLINFSGNW